MSLRSIVACLFSCLLLGPAHAAGDPFAELVRPTDPLSPAEELAAFVLPKGFEMQLVAAEPDLRKPMNMAFDVTGRLWFTESREYPFPAKPGEVGRDTIRILSDIGEDGRAKKVTIFAEGLNIPIGLYPFRSLNKETGKVTWKCIAWSIPNIWLFEDTDGDDKADKKTELYGPLGWEKDTHGNLASFRRGADGWLYGTHGFNNTSTMRGKDGSSITMQSGNTWRVALDGSRVEQITFGQVNPFGLCFDQRGNMFTADCHSSPIYQLIRGACYPSFGKPHDGLGFAPTTIKHTHGSTALCGIVYLDDLGWGDEYKDNIIVGNVGTSRINRDRIEWRGTSSIGHELPDFLSTKDPWFRPVDLQIGPDGALYIADFYNKIIGHYEVPLNHPGRDRERGRIWRMVYRGEQGDKKLEPAALPTEIHSLIGELASPNPTRRILALHELVDNRQEQAKENLNKLNWHVLSGEKQRQSLLSLLHRLGTLKTNDLISAMENEHPLVKSAAIKIAGEIKHWTPELRTGIQKALEDEDATTVRAAVEALGSHPAVGQVGMLLNTASSAGKDTHLYHAVKVALKAHLFEPKLVGAMDWEKFNPGNQTELLYEVLFVAKHTESLAARLKLFGHYPPAFETALKHFPQMAELLQQDERTYHKEKEEFFSRLRPYAKTDLKTDQILFSVYRQEAKKNTWLTSKLRELCDEEIEPLRKLGNDGVLVLLTTAKEVPHFLDRTIVREYLDAKNSTNEIKLAAAEAMLAFKRSEDSQPVYDILLNPATVGELREKLAVSLAHRQEKEDLLLIFQSLRLIPARAQNDVVKVLVGWKDGSAALLTAIDEGKAPAVLLREKANQDKLRAHKDAKLTKQLDAILAKLPPANVELDKLIAKRKTAAMKTEGHVERGLAVYKKTCAACHKLNNEGALVGPQLDGIGGRGLERLLEDVLDPNRNVDQAFRMTIITKKDGTVTSGLVRKDEGDDLLMVNQQGQEFTVKKDDIDERAEATTSLMPSVAESLPEGDLIDLMAFLLKQKPKTP